MTSSATFETITFRMSGWESSLDSTFRGRVASSLAVLAVYTLTRPVVVVIAFATVRERPGVLLLRFGSSNGSKYR